MKTLLFFCSLIIFAGCSATSELTNPILKKEIEPLYPYEAKVKGIEGKTEVLCLIDEEGNVSAAKVSRSSGHKILDNASIDYAKILKFEPATLNGKPLAVWVKWIVNYKLTSVDISREKIKVLLFSKANGFKHESISAGKTALVKLASENNFHIDITEDSTKFNDETLQVYDVIVFLNTTGNVLDEAGKTAFINFIHNKGGFAGIHSCTDMEKDWEWYGNMIGTRFKDHPEVQKAVIWITNKNHPSTKELPYKWARVDEWYNYTNDLPDNIKVLATVDESTYEGGTAGKYHPFCWYHEYEGGRCWYTSGGHTIESYSDPLFMNHILGGIKYAAGIE
jgi:TonB family protein